MQDRLGNVVSGVSVEEIATACVSLGDRSTVIKGKNGGRDIRSIDQVCQSSSFFSPLSRQLEWGFRSLFAIQICLNETGFASEPLFFPSYCLSLTFKEHSDAVLIRKH